MATGRYGGGVDTPIEQGCVVCGPGVRYEEYEVQEGMFRTGETFTYRACSGCGSLQIAAIPGDLSQYYDQNHYYSFESGDLAVLNPRWQKPLLRFGLRLNTAMYLRSGIGRGVPWARRAGLRTTDRILDLGCGWGETVLRLHVFGFRHVLGADPFLEGDRQVAPGVQVLKRHHGDLGDYEFDWVMMHHSFEHIPDPRATLASVHRFLGERGRLLIRTPVMGQFAWREYGSKWAQIDSPRHLVVYTLAGLLRLVEEEGFGVEKIFFDSTAFQFWGSEMIVSGKPHKAGSAGFSAQQLRRWQDRARMLNKAGDGDQVAVVLRPARDTFSRAGN